MINSTLRSDLEEKLSIFISARNLINLDVMSKSDPQAILYEKKIDSHNFIEIDKTEVIRDNLNPDFTKEFDVLYKFEEVQLYKIELYDIDEGSKDFVGSVEFTLASVMGSHENTKDYILNSKKGKPLKSSIRVRCEV